MDKPDLRGEMAIANARPPAPQGLRSRRRHRLGQVRARSAAASPSQDLAVTIDGATMRLGGRATLGPGFVPAEHPGRRRRRRQRPPARVRRARRGDGRPGQGARARPRARHAARSPRSAAGWISAPSTFACATWGRRCRCRAASSRSATRAPSCTTCASCWTTRACWSSAPRACAPGGCSSRAWFRSSPGEFDLPLHGEQLAYRSPERVRGRRPGASTWT